MANQFLGLALFIMLLSFFIVLNAISDFEENAAAKVLNSISLAFNADMKEEDTDDPADDAQSALDKGSALDQLEEFFDSQITGAKIERDRMGLMMHVSMPADKFENQILGFGAEDSDVDMKEVLISMLTGEENVTYRMEILLNLEDSPAKMFNTDEKRTMLGIRRVAFYAKLLEEAGMPGRLMTPGVKAGRDNMIDLFFMRDDENREGAS